jgi:hypothetical protein
MMASRQPSVRWCVFGSSSAEVSCTSHAMGRGEASILFSLLNMGELKTCSAVLQTCA